MADEDASARGESTPEPSQVYDAATVDSSEVGGSGEEQPDRSTQRDERRAQTIGDPDADVVFFTKPEERYEAKRRLGEGGMGEVHLCRDRVIGREVAMKVVLDEKRSRQEIHHRFVREARVQGQLEHPAIVPVYDFGQDDEGNAFFTMRRVRGVTLEQILDALRSGSPAAKRVHTRHKLLAAFVRVCLAIEFAHEHGVLHRDLKPGNVMLGRHGEVYVLDWGLAKVRSASRALDDSLLALQQERSSSAHMLPAGEEESERPSDRHPEISGVAEGKTAIGAILGTPQYMSPEQIKGEDIDARTDIYALGAILFEILTLEPLQGAGNVAAILSRAVHGVEARTSVRAPKGDVSPELERACVRATALNREDRFSHARELGDVIEAYLSGDRDLELRRELAQVHLSRAREAAGKESSLSLSDRATALQEVGRALALAPDDKDALTMLVGFLTTPPEVSPPEVTARVERAARQSQRKMLPTTAIAYGGTAALFLPLEMLFGVRDLKLVLIPLVLWLIAAALAFVSWKFSRPERDTYPLITISAAVALSASSVLHGPLIIVPAIAAIMAMGQILQTPRHNRALLLSSNVVALAVPTLFALFDLHPVHHAFVGGDLTISGAAILFSPTSIALVGLMHIAFIVVGALFVGSYRDQLRGLETRAHLQAWQLEQLVPAEAARALDPALPVRR